LFDSIYLCIIIIMSSSTAARTRVLLGYRRLFRARQSLFAGDTVALRESRTAIRAEFIKHKAVPTSGDQFEGLMTMVDEAEDMLRHSFLQGKLNEQTGNYRKSVLLICV
jgi:complex III assembly factor LYRM7